MDVRLPDGTVIQNVPDGTSRADLTAKLARNGYDISKLGMSQGSYNPAIDPTNNTDPTTGNTFLQNSAIGAGKAISDLGLGIKQLTGFADRSQADESKRLDAPLMKTGGGKVGNFVGNVAATLPLMAIPGANTLAGAALVGGGLGAAQPVGQNDSRMLNTALGAAAGAGGQYVGGKIASMVGSRIASSAGESAIPTEEALHNAATASYQEARNLGVQIKPQLLEDTSNNIISSLKDAGYRDYLAPKTFRAVSELTQDSGAPAALDDVLGVRKLLNTAAGDPAEKDAARRAIGHINDMLTNLSPEDVLSGDAGKAVDAIKNATANYAAYMRSKTVSTAMARAELNASSAGSGANIDNTTRQAIKSILTSPSKSRGFSADELDQMRQIVAGTFTGNTARLLGKLAPTGIVSGALSSGAGFVAGGAPGAIAAPVVGAIGKKIGDMSTQNQAQILANLVRSRAPLFAQNFLSPQATSPFLNMLSGQMPGNILQGLLTGGALTYAPQQ